MGRWNITPRLTKFARSMRIVPFLAIVLLLPMLGGCSKSVSIAPIPALQANLAAPCPSLPAPPDPLNDPARAVWEMDLIAAYGDCASRHLATVKAIKKIEANAQ